MSQSAGNEQHGMSFPVCNASDWLRAIYRKNPAVAADAT
jgi:hypothetical protein